MKTTKREKEIIALVNDGYRIFTGRDNVFLSKGFHNINIQCSLFWRMYGHGIFTQNNGDFELSDEFKQPSK